MKIATMKIGKDLEVPEEVASCVADRSANDMAGLEDWVYKARKAGLTRQAMVDTLVGSGWAATFVDWYLGATSSEGESDTASSFAYQPPERGKIASFIAGFAISRRRAALKAARAGNLDRIAALIASRRDLISAELGRVEGSLLHVAAGAGHKELVEWLLANGANAEAASISFGLSPLHLAAEHDHGQIAALLIAHGADPRAATRHFGATPLHMAAEAASAETVRVLLDAGAEVDARTLPDWHWATPLHAAALGGDHEVVRRLLSHGADVRAKASYGRTTLHFSAGNASTEAARLLIAAGANVNAKKEDPSPDDDGATPLHWAAQLGNEAMIQLLLDAKAELNSKTKSGLTPLKTAEKNNQSKAVALLRKLGE